MATRHGDRPATAVVQAVADAEGCDPDELTEPLYAAVDPDAVDTLFDPETDPRVPNGRFTFTYCGYEVTLYSDGTVELDESDPSL